MKKTVLILLAALFWAPLAFAQNSGWEIHMGIGSGLYDRTRSHSEIVYRSDDENDNARSQSDASILPTVLFTAGYNLENAPVGFFVDLAWNYAWNKLEGGPSLLRENENIFHLVPSVRLYYIQNENFRMYATLGADLRYRHFAETYQGSTCSNSDFKIGYELSPIGFSWGERWAISFDLGYGTPWSLARVSVGYRF